MDDSPQHHDQGSPCQSARGKWCVEERKFGVRVDASSLATGVSLERCGTVVEDACWLRSEKDSQHINLAELDAIIKGMNLALLLEGDNVAPIH